MSAVGALLSELRKTRRLSQLDLGGMADVSARHISFIETGRTQPSREMLLHLADVLEVPLRDRNMLLTSGGYAMVFPEQRLEDPVMAPVRDALKLMLENHNPYPAIVLDGDWNLVMANSAQQRLAAQLSGPVSNSEPNLLKMMFQSERLRHFIENWDAVAGFLLRRLKRQVLAYGRPSHQQLLKELLQMNPPGEWEHVTTLQTGLPMITVNIKVADKSIKLFSTLSQFGTALDVGMEELLIESYFPADNVTREFFVGLTSA